MLLSSLPSDACAPASVLPSPNARAAGQHLPGAVPDRLLPPSLRRRVRQPGAFRCLFFSCVGLRSERSPSLTQGRGGCHHGRPICLGDHRMSRAGAESAGISIAMRCTPACRPEPGRVRSQHWRAACACEFVCRGCSHQIGLCRVSIVLLVSRVARPRMYTCRGKESATTRSVLILQVRGDRDCVSGARRGPLTRTRRIGAHLLASPEMQATSCDRIQQGRRHLVIIGHSQRNEIAVHLSTEFVHNHVDRVGSGTQSRSRGKGLRWVARSLSTRGQEVRRGANQLEAAWHRYG